MIFTSITRALMASFAMFPTVFRTYEKRYIRLKETDPNTQFYIPYAVKTVFCEIACTSCMYIHVLHVCTGSKIHSNFSHGVACLENTLLHSRIRKEEKPFHFDFIPCNCHENRVSHTTCCKPMKLYIVEKSQEKMPILFLYLPIASKIQFYILLAVKTLNYTYE